MSKEENVQCSMLNTQCSGIEAGRVEVFNFIDNCVILKKGSDKSLLKLGTA